MSSEADQKCSQCGGLIPEGSAHCPACMLGKAMGVGDSLEEFADETTSSFDLGPVTEGVGDTIGSYSLLERLGEGGFGVVWAAEQKQPVKRRVALKIIKLGMDTKQVVARFEAERQALAMMDHPNIAKVLDAGSTDTGRPYFVMELVKGIPITKYFEQEGTEVTEKLELFVRVCQAIQHAHQKGIIHRDIKPSNILITLHDGVPVPKVIDFGIAKATQGELTDKTIYTQYSQFIGTPAYMSPEQAELSGLDIDTRADVYSLGVLLYEILTGTTPFDSHELARSGLDAMRKIIREREPEKPSTRMSQTISAGEAKRSRVVTPETVSRVRGDLDWIVMKCLEKDRTRRYETATGLARDVERYLSDEPVTAVAPTFGYQLQKFYRRNRPHLRVAAAVAILLVASTVFSFYQWMRASAQSEKVQSANRDNVELLAEQGRLLTEAKEQTAEATAAKRDLSEELYYADMYRIAQAYNESDIDRVLSLLSRHDPIGDEPDFRGPEWRIWWGAMNTDVFRAKAKTGVYDIAYSEPKDLVATLDIPGVISVYQARSKILLEQFVIYPEWAEYSEFRNIDTGNLVFSPDGKWLVAAGDDLRLRRWNTSNWERIHPDIELAKGDSKQLRTQNILFSPDGSLCVVVTLWEGIFIFDGDTFDLKQHISYEGRKMEFRGFSFSPNGKRLVGVVPTGRIEPKGGPGLIVRIEAPFVKIEEVVEVLVGHGLAFSPDGDSVLTMTVDGLAQRPISDLSQISNHLVDLGSEIPYKIRFSPSGRYVAVATMNGSVLIWEWEAASMSLVSNIKSTPTLARDIEFANNETEIWVGGNGLSSLRVFAIDSSGLFESVPDSRLTSNLSFLGGGRLAWQDVSRGKDKPPTPIKVYDVGSKEFQLWNGGSRYHFLGASDNGKYLLTLGEDRVTTLWDANTGEALSHLPLSGVEPRDISYLTASNDGQWVAWSQFDVVDRQRQDAYLWSASARELYSMGTEKDETPMLAFNSNSTGFARIVSGRHAQFWRLSQVPNEMDGIRVLSKNFRSIDAFRFSPTGTGFAIGQYEDIYWINDADRPRLLGGHSTGIDSLAFSSNSTTLYSSAGGSVKLWDIASGKQRAELPRQSVLAKLVADRDGEWLAVKGLMEPMRIVKIPSESTIENDPDYAVERVRRLAYARRWTEAEEVAERLRDDPTSGVIEKHALALRSGDRKESTRILRSAFNATRGKMTIDLKLKLAFRLVLEPGGSELQRGLDLAEEILAAVGEGVTWRRQLAAIAAAYGHYRMEAYDRAEDHLESISKLHDPYNPELSDMKLTVQALCAQHRGEPGAADMLSRARDGLLGNYESREISWLHMAAAVVILNEAERVIEGEASTSF